MATSRPVWSPTPKQPIALANVFCLPTVFLFVVASGSKTEMLPRRETKQHCKAHAKRGNGLSPKITLQIQVVMRQYPTRIFDFCDIFATLPVPSVERRTQGPVSPLARPSSESEPGPPGTPDPEWAGGFRRDAPASQE